MCVYVRLTRWARGFVVVMCFIYVDLYDMCLYVCLLILLKDIFEVKKVRLTSGAAFPSRALGCLLSHKLKPEHSLVCVCLCVLCHTSLSCPPILTSSSSFTQPPRQRFHTDSSAHPPGQRNHGAATYRDKNRVYFPPKHFSVRSQPKNQSGDRKDCQIEPYGAHC